MSKWIGCLMVVLMIGGISLTACDDSDDPTPTASTSNSPSETPTPSPTLPETTTPPTSTSTAPQTSTPAPNGGGVELAVGQKAYYAFFEDGVEFGHNKYEVVSQEEQSEGNIFALDSHLELKSSTVCQPTTVDATLKVGQDGNLISYVSSASIGSG